MFPTASHPEKADKVEGPALMHAVTRRLDQEGLRKRVAVIGVGGIGDERTCQEVMAGGADGVAVIGALAKASDAKQEAIKIRRHLSDASEARGGSGRRPPS
jgi:thiamine monophosphate synthase